MKKSAPRLDAFFHASCDIEKLAGYNAAFFNEILGGVFDKFCISLVQIEGTYMERQSIACRRHFLR